MLIGCPKLDNMNYAMKIAEIFKTCDIRSVTIACMTVLCCGGLSFAVKTAVELRGKEIPVRVVTIILDGQIQR